MASRKKKSAQKSKALSKDGGIVIQKEKLAIYKDTTGRKHTFSAVCTHLGCVVSWNELEKSFDCPCHGSRFSGKTGNVINGPANSQLQIKKK